MTHSQPPTLRTGRLFWLARYFEQHPKEFDQLNYCGTALCVGGLTVWQWGTDAQRHEMDCRIQRIPHVDRHIDFGTVGAPLLGLMDSQRWRLFPAVPLWLTQGASCVHQAKEVAVTLRHLARTGEMLTSPPNTARKA